MKEQKSLMMFEESVKSPISRKKYIYLVKLFMDYHKIKTFDDIVKNDVKELQALVETYVIHIKKSVNPNTVPSYLVPIATFLEVNDIDLNWKKIKRLYPAKIKRSGSSAYQTEDVKLMLDATPQLRNRALIHFIASTGVRAGGIQDLTLGNLRDMPQGCKMVLIYEDSTEEYNTFLTPEATNALELYFNERKSEGELLNDDSPIFRERYQLASAKAKALSTEAIQGVLARCTKNAAIRGQKKNGRYSEQLVHGLRKRFNTILKLNNSVNDNAIEKMMGHKKGLDGAYLQMTPERLFEEFSKGILDLTIDQTEKQKVKIESLEADKSELEETKGIVENQKESIRLLINEEIGKLLKTQLDMSDIINKLDGENDKLKKELSKK
jgi:integrase